MRDLTQEELSVVITALDSAVEDEGANKPVINKLLELYEMELLLLREPRKRRGPVSKDSKGDLKR